ncbi:MAG: DUF4258 domain-containing protein [Betaproteobacteria bacterium]|nr:DUF4258 domain-containing protein [Betaproteobacteria bacterium]
MLSGRFGKLVIITDHARRRMAERNISEAQLLDLIETGDVRYKDAARLWIAKSFPEREDNLVCAVAVLDAALVVKTVMHHFSWEP